MKVTKAHVQSAVKAWRTKRWVRITGFGVAMMVCFSAGNSQGLKEGDPRQGGPGNTATIEQLQGKWDGIGVMPDGQAFCMVGWPCEDGFLSGK